MAKKKRIQKLFSKIVVILFMIMIVLGFTIPGFINSGNPTTNPQQKIVEPRLCQSDTDCYLICDEPVSVLCSNNLCQQNSCDEYSYYPFVEEPITFQLSVEIENKEISLPERVNPNDFFITFDDKVNIFSTGVALVQILEKFNIFVSEQCLFVDDVDYCTEDLKEFKVLINGEKSNTFGFYKPNTDDVIELVYG